MGCSVQTVELVCIKTVWTLRMKYKHQIEKLWYNLNLLGKQKFDIVGPMINTIVK